MGVVGVLYGCLVSYKPNDQQLIRHINKPPSGPNGRGVWPIDQWSKKLTLMSNNLKVKCDY